jgi:outer membrane cobalamin receptor
MIAKPSVILVTLLLSVTASAQIQNEPTEIITASPPATFSERSGLWPVDKLPESNFTNDRTTLADRWNSVPGVQARESGSPTISIRGSAQADRVLQLFDGAPLNMADGVGASSLLIPTEVMSDVSLMKGPASVFYGNSAMAGVIDHRLRYFDRPTVTGSLADTGGEFGDRHGALVVPIHSRDDKPVAQFSILSERNPGNFLYQSSTSTLAGRRDHNSQDLSRATAATDFVFGSGWAFSARVVEATLSGESPGSLYFPSSSLISQTASLATAQLSRKFSESTLASLRLTDTRIWGLYDANTASPTTSFVSRTSLFADFNTQLSDSLLLRSFGDLSVDSLTASYVGSAHYDEHDADLGQTFQFSVSPALSLQPSYRYQSRYGQIFKSFAAVFENGPSTSSLKLSEGFRAPSLTDRFGTFSTFVANPGLQPEKSWTAELGTNLELGRRYGGFLEGFGAKSSVYYTKYNDLVDTLTQGATFTKVNSGEARSIGGELSAAYGFKIWMLSAGFNYLDAKNITSNEPLRLSPRHQAVASLAQLLGPVLIEAKETYWSSFSDRDPTSGLLKELPSWTTFDFTVRTLALTRWEFRAGVLNLFDHARELTYGYPEPQRRFFASAARSF